MADGPDVTFLFTDIVGSTVLWETHPSEMAATLDRHDAITRATVDAHGGSIIDFSGDGAFAVFDGAIDALRASIELQVSFATQRWPHGGELRVRAGLHTGAAVRRGDRYSGPEVHRAARIMQQASGAQVLISDATRRRILDGLDPAIDLTQFGRVALRGLRHAELVFEVRHPGMPAAAALADHESPAAGRIELFERDAEMEVLRTAWERARTGSGSLVLVLGEPGVGKTSLVRAFGQEVAEPTLAGSCDDLSTPRSFGAIRDLALDARGPLASATFDDRDGVFESLLGELRRGPTMVVLEDLHWADDATLDAITLIARRIDRLPTLLVLTSRPAQGPAARLQRAVAGAPSVSTITLGSLSPSSVTAWAAGSGVDPAELYRLTGGNPLFVDELLTGDPATLPSSVRDATLARLEPLSGRAREAADLLAIIPGAVPQWLVEMLIEPPGLLVEVEQAGLIAIDEDVVRFRHELTRRAIEDAIPIERHRRLHGDVAGVLSNAGADHASVAHHAFAARRTDLIRLHVPAAVGDAMRSGGHRQALDLLDRLDAQLDRGDVRLHAWAQLQRAEALHQLDRAEDALAAAQRAVAMAQSGDSGIALAQALALAGRASWWLRDLPSSSVFAAAALNVLDTLEPDGEASLVLSRVARLLALARDPKASEVSRQALDMARVVGSRRAAALARMAIGLSGDVDQLFDHLLGAIAEARAAADGVTEALATTNLATAYTFAHRYDAAEQWLPRAKELAHRFEQKAGYSVACGLLPWLRAMRGDLHGALEGLIAYDGLVDEENQRAWGWAHRAVVLARLGRTGEALGLLEEARDMRIGRALDPRLVYEAAAVEVHWLAGTEIDGDRIRDRVLVRNLHAFPQDYLGRLGRGLQRAGFEVPVLDLRIGGYDEAMAGRSVESARVWKDLGNPYEAAVEMALCGEVAGFEALESLGARGVLRRIADRSPV